MHGHIHHILSVILLAMGCRCMAQETAGAQSIEAGLSKISMSEDGTEITICSPLVKRDVHLHMITDSHMDRCDSREDPTAHLSRRMRGPYDKARHYATGEPGKPLERFDEAMRRSQESPADALVMLGDIVSYPSLMEIEYVDSVLTDYRGKTGRPTLYTVGNHDWHYEHEHLDHEVESPQEELILRQKWIDKRLFKLYPKKVSRHPAGSPKGSSLAYCVNVKGINILMIDDGVWGCILPEQLEFFRKVRDSGKPFILCMHIPLYVDGVRGFSCGDPSWNWDNDGGYELEGRERWPKAGHDETTLTFRKEVISAPNLLACFHGHVHHSSLNVQDNLPVITLKACVNGALNTIHFIKSNSHNE